jgi:hypothetical protein
MRELTENERTFLHERGIGTEDEAAIIHVVIQYLRQTLGETMTVDSAVILTEEITIALGLAKELGIHLFISQLDNLQTNQGTQE